MVTLRGGFVRAVELVQVVAETVHATHTSHAVLGHAAEDSETAASTSQFTAAGVDTTGHAAAAGNDAAVNDAAERNFAGSDSDAAVGDAAVGDAAVGDALIARAREKAQGRTASGTRARIVPADQVAAEPAAAMLAGGAQPAAREVGSSASSSNASSNASSSANTSESSKETFYDIELADAVKPAIEAALRTDGSAFRECHLPERNPTGLHTAAARLAKDGHVMRADFVSELNELGATLTAACP